MKLKTRCVALLGSRFIDKYNIYNPVRKKIWGKRDLPIPLFCWPSTDTRSYPFDFTIKKKKNDFYEFLKKKMS